MQDIRPTYSQEENQYSQPEESASGQFQTFTITRNKVFPVIIGFLGGLVILLIILNSDWFKTLSGFPSFLVMVAWVLLFTGFLEFISNYFKSKKTIELYFDKLVIIDNETETIPFTNIKRYCHFYSPGGSGQRNLIIKLNNGKKKRISGDNRDLLNLTHSFEVNIQEHIKLSSLPIEKYDEDEEFARYAIPIVVIGGGLTIVLSVLFLLWRNR